MTVVQDFRLDSLEIFELCCVGERSENSEFWSRCIFECCSVLTVWENNDKSAE
jgi:hypothetical protein